MLFSQEQCVIFPGFPSKTIRCEITFSFFHSYLLNAVSFANKSTGSKNA